MCGHFDLSIVNYSYRGGEGAPLAWEGPSASVPTHPPTPAREVRSMQYLKSLATAAVFCFSFLIACVGAVPCLSVLWTCCSESALSNGGTAWAVRSLA